MLCDFVSTPLVSVREQDESQADPLARPAIEAINTLRREIVFIVCSVSGLCIVARTGWVTLCESPCGDLRSLHCINTYTGRISRGRRLCRSIDI